MSISASPPRAASDISEGKQDWVGESRAPGDWGLVDVQFGRTESSLKRCYYFTLKPSESICLNSDSHRGRNANCTRTKKADVIHTVCHCPALAWKRCRTLGHVFLVPKAPENMRVNCSKWNQRDAVQQVFYCTLVASTCFGCRRHPSSGAQYVQSRSVGTMCVW